MEMTRFDGLLGVAGAGYEADATFLMPRKVSGISKPDREYDPMEPGKLREMYLAFRGLRKHVRATEWVDYDSEFINAVVGFANKYGPLTVEYETLREGKPCYEHAKWYDTLYDIEFAASVLADLKADPTKSKQRFKDLVDSKGTHPVFSLPFSPGKHIHSRIYRSIYPRRLTPPKPWGTREVVTELLQQFVNSALADETALMSTLQDGAPFKPAPASVLGAIYLGFVAVETGGGVPKLCESGCGTIIPTTHGNRRYCSVQCQERHKKQKQRERKA